MAKRSPQQTDIRVGQRVRMARHLMVPQMSQTTLGDKIGLTFQQVQKYEKGSNRIGASRLQQIANVFGRPVAWFFGDEATVSNPGADLVEQMLAAPYGVDLARAYVGSGMRNLDRQMLASLAARLAVPVAIADLQASRKKVA